MSWDQIFIYVFFLLLALGLVCFVIFELYELLLIIGFLLTILPPILNIIGWQVAGQFMTESFMIGVGCLLTVVARLVAAAGDRTDLIRGNWSGTSSLDDIKREIQNLSEDIKSRPRG